MNSAVGPILKIFLNKVVVGPVNFALCLLYSESMCMNSAVTVYCVLKKKKWKRKTENADAQ